MPAGQEGSDRSCFAETERMLTRLRIWLLLDTVMAEINTAFQAASLKCMLKVVHNTGAQAGLMGMAGALSR